MFSAWGGRRYLSWGTPDCRLAGDQGKEGTLVLRVLAPDLTFFSLSCPSPQPGLLQLAEGRWPGSVAGHGDLGVPPFHRETTLNDPNCPHFSCPPAAPKYCVSLGTCSLLHCISLCRVLG